MGIAGTWLSEDVHSLSYAAVAIVAGAISSWLAYCAALEPAGIASQLVAAAFDTHIREFYERSGVRFPKSPAEDAEIGQAITAALEGKPPPGELREVPRSD
jgi:hypothetical protein